MSYEPMNAGVAQSRHEDLIRELNSPVGQMRSRLAYERRLQRASQRARLRDRLVRSWRRKRKVAEHELAA